MKYKILSKIITKFLKSILPSIISKEQSTFVKERGIGNNIGIA
jgi:hypothetical protein